MATIPGILMKSNILQITEVKTITKAKMFENLAVGSKIILSIPATTAGQNRGTYASYIKVENIDNGEYAKISFNNIIKRLKPFSFKEIN